MSSLDNELVCPHCRQRTRSKVVDSRGTKTGEWIRRRRECSCGQRFTTLETLLDADSVRPGVEVKDVIEAVGMVLTRMLT
jgi:transcriptional regulator NrdR family protein